MATLTTGQSGVHNDHDEEVTHLKSPPAVGDELRLSFVKHRHSRMKRNIWTRQVPLGNAGGRCDGQCTFMITDPPRRKKPERVRRVRITDKYPDKTEHSRYPVYEVSLIS